MREFGDSQRQQAKAMSTRAYPLARGCDAQLNSWCNANCPHYGTHGPLFARFDRAEKNPNEAWRCYAQSTLSPDGGVYVRGTDYCTRDAELRKVLDDCEFSGITMVSVDAQGAPTKLNRPSPPPQVPRPQPPSPSVTPPVRISAAAAELGSSISWDTRLNAEKCCRAPLYINKFVDHPTNKAPHYEHLPAFMQLPSALKLPRLEDCAAELVEAALFWAASLYTSSYAAKAQRLVTSCEAWGVCCNPALMPDGALVGVQGENKEGSYARRHRLIATKPLFIYEVLRLSPLPLAWLDVDLEFHSFPTLFTPSAWANVPSWDGRTPATANAPAPRDVLLWNWQAPVPFFEGRRLKMASGVAWFNKTAPAEALLLAWSEAMAYELNVAAPDDQVMDLLVNEDRWIDRVAFGWLPESYLRMMPRHAHIVPVIDHDRGGPVSQKGRNSPVDPVLPPKKLIGPKVNT